MGSRYRVSPDARYRRLRILALAGDPVVKFFAEPPEWSTSSPGPVCSLPELSPTFLTFNSPRTAMKPGSELSRALESVSIPTVGETFEDGTLIDLLASPSSPKRLSLILRRGNRSITGRRLFQDGRYYVPADLSPTLLEGMYLPGRAENYRSTRALFDSLVRMFTTKCRLSAREAQLPAYYELATHFADCFPALPSLAVVAADATDATRFLRVLAAGCRHALPLADLQSAALGRLPRGLRPTLILCQSLLTSATVRSLRASRNQGFGVLQLGGVADLCCPTAIAINEEASEELIAMANLEVYLEPNRATPLVRDADLKAIAAELQPVLLDYRLKNHAAVRTSSFDVPQFESATRETARALGACIVGDPELQAGVVEALKGRDEAKRSWQWTTPSSLVVEALLVLCHEPGRTSVYVGDIAEVANGILTGRKESVELSPRKVGPLLRALNVTSTTDRNSNGYNFLLMNDSRRRIHELARGFGLPWMKETAGRCEFCAAVMASE
jgi:hypothetical protein